MSSSSSTPSPSKTPPATDVYNLDDDNVFIVGGKIIDGYTKADQMDMHRMGKQQELMVSALRDILQYQDPAARAFANWHASEKFPSSLRDEFYGPGPSYVGIYLDVKAPDNRLHLKVRVVVDGFVSANTQGLTDGGIAGLFWSFVWTFLGLGIVMLSLAEMASM